MTFRTISIFAGALWIALSAAALLWPDRHPASPIMLIGFHLSCVAMLVALVPQPRSHAYSTLAVLLVLGFWTKLLVRLVVPYPYLEPIGRFDGSTAAWNRALAVVIAANAGVVVARVIHLVLARRRIRAETPALPTTPPFYARHWRAIWTIAIGVIVVTYAWNAYARVQVTGVNPLVVLPLKLNALLAWWYLLALPLVLAMLLGWEMTRRGDVTLTSQWLLVPIGEAIVNSASMLSRASYLLRLVPYLIAPSGPGARGSLKLTRPRVFVATLLVCGFVVSLAATMVLRTRLYYSSARQEAATSTAPTPRASATAPLAPTLSTPPASRQESGFVSRPVFFAVREIGTLVVDRWIGLEGVLAITSWPDQTGLMSTAWHEDPNVGQRALYQRIAGAGYAPLDGFTFLTLPGIVALVAMSGSLAIVAIGMALVTLWLIGSESLLRIALRNELVCAVAAVGAVFLVTQANFPKLLAIHAVELWLTIGVLALIQAVVTRAKPRALQSARRTT